MSAPLTTAAFGSTRCPGCEKRFATTPGRTVDLEGTEAVRNRYGGFSDGRTRPVTRRWHASCLKAFEQQNEAYRARVKAEQEQHVRELCEELGLDYDQIAKGV